MNLQQYDRIKLELADILRSATMRPAADREQDSMRDLFGRLAEDRFNLVVVGRFSRGKTSLMNAMLSVAWLPTGVVPVTSVITTVTYGTVEQVVLHYLHTSLFLEIPITQLADHITEQGNPGNRRRISIADVQLPAELLRRGFHFIDTPGLGSSIIENTRTTEAFLPEADAFILVTSYDSPLSEEEQRTLQTIHGFGRRVFIIVNKQDNASLAQRREVIEHLKARLPLIFGDNLPPIFSVSAQQALGARLLQDAAKLDESGLPPFEAALLDFLINHSHREFLRNMCARVGDILAGASDADADMRRLATLTTELEADQSSATFAMPAAPREVLSPTLPACEICAAVADTVFDFVTRYQHQLGGRHDAQIDLAGRHGLCAPHTFLFEAVAAPGEICSGFAGVMEQQARCLRAAARSGRPARDTIAEILPTARTCPVCESVKRAEQRAIDATASYVARDAAAGLAHLSAICLPHLGPLLEVIEDSGLAKSVLLREAHILDRLAEDMRRFVLKRDAMRRHLMSKEEGAAALRALRILIGHPRAQMGPATYFHRPATSGSSGV